MKANVLDTLHDGIRWSRRLRTDGETAALNINVYGRGAKGKEARMEASIQKYEAFAATVEHGSFTKAAEALSYSQSGISRMIADLERDWDVVLLERGRGGVRLTSDGTRLLPFVKNVLAEHGRLLAEIDEMHGLESGLIRIGIISSVAAQWLPNVIRAFQQDYPGIDYELLLGDYDEIEAWVEEGRVDCGFVKLPAPPGLDVLELGEDRFMAVVPEGHPLARLDRVPLAMLCDDPFLLLERGRTREVRPLFEQRGLRPNVHFATWDDYAIMAMVESGLGVSVLPSLVLRRIPYRVVVRELAEPTRRTLALATRGGERPTAAVQKFKEYLRFR